MIYDEYEAFLEKYKKEYGENTVVLMECGHFYELYDDGTKQTDLKYIGELLNIQVSRKNKSIIEVNRANLEMAGFPSYALKKYINTLIINNYTVVIVSQVTPPPKVTRAVTDIISPGTYLDEDSKQESNYLMSLFFLQCQEYKSNKPCLSVGVSLIDLSIGKTYCFETSSRSNDLAYPLDEVYRITSSFNPVELIICGNSIDETTRVNLLDFKKIVGYLDLEDKCVHNDFYKYDSSILKITYQEELLRRVYPSTGILSRIEYLGLERKPCALLSYIRLLQFCNNHNENILNKVGVPHIIEETNSLILSYNSIKQLDIITTGERSTKNGSLLGILNNCKTAMGRRYFKERLLCPINDVSRLNQSYYTIQTFKNNSTLMILNTELGSVYDTERIFRRIDMLHAHPHELANLINTLSKLVKIICEVFKHQTVIDNLCLQEVSSDTSKIINYMQAHLAVEELCKYNLDNINPKVFGKGYNAVLDELYDELQLCKDFTNTLVDKLNELAKDTFFKVESNDRDGFHLLITLKRYTEFKKVNRDATIIVMEHTIKIVDLIDKQVSSSSTNIKVTHKLMQINNEKHDSLSMKIKKITTDVYKNFLAQLSDLTSQCGVTISKTLACIDFYWCCAYNAVKFGYTCPNIDDKFSHKSYIVATGLRHAIIERISNDVQYVDNDIQLGTESCDGILLYGLNSSGKSSLMKSIGITIVMAQAGMFVPCEQLTYYPYDYMFTRILSCDDIFKAQSTFTKEMLELRGILKRANRNSLVLGDELCSGTESISALSIVSAGIKTLADRKTSFIFATHLHDLVNIDVVKNLTNVKAFHLSVEYDVKTRKLIFDRKLKDGNGSTLYGLEVCKSLDLDEDFMEIANSIRKKLVHNEANIVSVSESSKYNKDVYVRSCGVCGESATEVHHIHEQHTADEMGMIGNFHKNSKFNLVPLCTECHKRIHYGNLIIHGYVQTSNGVELKTSSSQQQSRYSEEDVKRLIRDKLEAQPRISKQNLAMHVLEKTVDFSRYKINKLINEVKIS